MNKYFIKNFGIIFFSFLFLELLFKTLSFGFKIDFELLRIILFTSVLSLIISLLVSLFKPKTAKIIISIIIFIFGLYDLLELNFNNFMGNFMSLSMLKSGDATRITNEIKTFIINIKPYYYLCFLPFIISLLYKKSNYEKLEKKHIIEIIAITLLIHIISLTTLFITPKTQLKSNKSLYTSPTLLNTSLKEFGVHRFLLRDLKYFINDNNYELIKTNNTNNITNDKIINNLYNYYNYDINTINEYTGIFKDKNLILIMVEALDMSAIDENLTPTLYNLANNGWYFNNYYAPRFSCATGESEFIAEVSLIPSNTTCTPFSYLNNTYSTSIFNIFKNSNYDTTSFHDWTDQYYPREQLHKNMGSTYYGANALNIDTSNYWPSDLTLMEKTYDILKNKDKFMSFIITVSTHFTYDTDDTISPINWDKVKNLNTIPQMKRYLSKAIELDKGLNYLIENLKKDNKLNDTVIVIFGDHHPYDLDINAINERSYVDRTIDMNEDLMPFIIYNPQIDHQIISKTASTFDILPTLANLFDLSYNPNYYMGNDIFSDNETIAIFPNGSWITDKAIYFANDNKYKLKEEINEDYIIKINNIVNNKFIASNNTLKKDYFKYLKNSVNE